MVQIVLIWPPSIRSSEWRGIISITSAVCSTSRLSTRAITFHALHVTLGIYSIIKKHGVSFLCYRNDESEACGSICRFTLIILIRVNQAMVKQQRQVYQRQKRDRNNTGQQQNNQSFRRQDHKGRWQRINSRQTIQGHTQKDQRNTGEMLRHVSRGKNKTLQWVWGKVLLK